MEICGERVIETARLPTGHAVTMRHNAISLLLHLCVCRYAAKCPPPLPIHQVPSPFIFAHVLDMR